MEEVLENPDDGYNPESIDLSSFHNSQKQNFIKNDPGDKINGEVQNNMISNASNISQDLQPSVSLPIFGVFIAPSLNKEKNSPNFSRCQTSEKSFCYPTPV